MKASNTSPSSPDPKDSKKSSVYLVMTFFGIYASVGAAGQFLIPDSIVEIPSDATAPSSAASLTELEQDCQKAKDDLEYAARKITNYSRSSGVSGFVALKQKMEAKKLQKALEAAEERADRICSRFLRGQQLNSSESKEEWSNSAELREGATDVGEASSTQ